MGKDASKVCSCLGDLRLQHTVHTAEVLLRAGGEELLKETPPLGLRPALKLQRTSRCVVLNPKIQKLHSLGYLFILPRASIHKYVRIQGTTHTPYLNNIEDTREPITTLHCHCAHTWDLGLQSTVVVTKLRGRVCSPRRAPEPRGLRTSAANNPRKQKG